ncbi:hypothetical protein H6P81_011251 [Aristolochia fimbriata]|uniref:Pentatricopeptide repeat-containing protein n=1 Tax=Aristolochia fimbriata TaxID=158543 RepID=A0AAV7ETW7_ARIFI|nr:hypothetical protein H6P81_011251 [Aristolochia fimbriata]
MTPVLHPKHVASVIKYHRDPIRALEIFNSVVKEDGFKHNLLSYKCMIEKLGCHCEFKAMENVLSDMRMNIDKGLLEGVYVGVMKIYGRYGRIQEAVDVFERMDFYNCEPSVLSYNAIMNILVEYKYFDQAHKVYLRMLDKGIVPDVYTFTIRIKSFCRTNRPHVALRLLKNMPEQGCNFNSVAYCTLIGGFYEENFKVEAYDLFDEMLNQVGFVPSLPTFGRILNCLCMKQWLKEAVGVIHTMVNKGIVPEVVKSIFKIDKRELQLPYLFWVEVKKSGRPNLYLWMRSVELR